MASYLKLAKKLQQALNSKGEKILLNTSQFYSDITNGPINVYCVRKGYYDETRKRNQSVELFSSTSQLQILLYLRDYWYEVNGWEVPTDNLEWLKKKEMSLSKSVYQRSQ